jgi:glycerol-3-phosphate dehydrogenase
VTQARARWSFLDAIQVERMVRAYGTRLERILGGAASLSDLGPAFAGDLTGAEVRYLMRDEWAQSAEDVLWRRTKTGLRASAKDADALAQFMASEAA